MHEYQQSRLLVYGRLTEPPPALSRVMRIAYLVYLRYNDVINENTSVSVSGLSLPEIREGPTFLPQVWRQRLGRHHQL